MNKNNSRSGASTRSVGTKKVYTAEEMKEMEEKLAEAWKQYGRDNEIGRDLYKMYGRHHKPKVDVPIPKTQPWDYKVAALKEKKPCPQQAKIEYPEVVTKQDILKRKAMAKFTKLDTIPKRKNYNEILQELALLKQERANYIPINKGVDRKNMINSLQDKFKYANQPAGPQLSAEEEQKINLALDAKMKQLSKKNYFTGVKEKEKALGVGEKGAGKGRYESEELRQLDELFEEVIREIEERQRYLAEVEHLDMEDGKEKVKGEIASRVGELEKINRMIKEEKRRVKGGDN